MGGDVLINQNKLEVGKRRAELFIKDSSRALSGILVLAEIIALAEDDDKNPFSKLCESENLPNAKSFYKANAIEGIRYLVDTLHNQGDEFLYEITEYLKIEV